MAGHGPPPKPAGQRRRRNKEPVERVTLDGAPSEVPPMPPGDWSEWTRTWWNRWVTSAQAKQFTGPTWSRLELLTSLAEAAHRGSLEHLKELRLQEASMGATPADLLRLRWEPGKQAPVVRERAVNGVTNVTEIDPRRRAPRSAPGAQSPE